MIISEILNVLGPTLKIIENLTATAKKSYEDKKSYEEKLENASGNDVYKYVLLINVSALEGYVAQARLQAQQSFSLSKVVAVAGFIIISIAIGLSVYLTVKGNENLNAAYLAGIAGVLTEFTSGVFFFLYSKTLGQINLFHDKLVDMQKTALSYLASRLPEAPSDKKGSDVLPGPVTSEANKAIKPSAEGGG